MDDLEWTFKCGDNCIQKADNYVESCIGTKPEYDCYSEANRISIDCMENCPCYAKCPNCKDKCSDFCPDETQKCMLLWSDEHDLCITECRKPREQCYQECDTATCRDKCDMNWIQREICCQKHCPCESKCSDGCPCYAEFDCDPPSLNGQDFCPTLNGPDPNCVKENFEDVNRCIDICLEKAYECTQRCPTDEYCFHRCQEEETECKSHCPCYKHCPNGCPCPGGYGNCP